jgi:hypothetical protein
MMDALEIGSGSISATIPIPSSPMHGRVRVRERLGD